MSAIHPCTTFSNFTQREGGGWKWRGGVRWRGGGKGEKGYILYNCPYLTGPEDDPVEVFGHGLRWVGWNPVEVLHLLHHLLPPYGDRHWAKTLVHTKEVLVLCKVEVMQFHNVDEVITITRSQAYMHYCL